MAAEAICLDDDERLFRTEPAAATAADASAVASLLLWPIALPMTSSDHAQCGWVRWEGASTWAALAGSLVRRSRLRGVRGTRGVETQRRLCCPALGCGFQGFAWRAGR